jgi:predicted PolB exonuclease-like 3'-5' exonuclease
VCLAREGAEHAETEMKLYVKTVLNGSDKILAYNGRSFDIPFLSAWIAAADTALCQAWQDKTIDFLHEAKVRINQYISMDKVAKDNALAISKIATGLQAIQWAQERQWQLLVEYCSADVDVLVQIFERALGKRGLKMVGKTRKFSSESPACITLFVGDELECVAEDASQEREQEARGWGGEACLSAEDIDGIFGM